MGLFGTLGLALGSLMFVALKPPASWWPFPRLRTRPRVRAAIVAVLLLLLPFAVAAFIDLMTADLSETYARAKKGFAVQPSGLLQIRVEPVTARWLGDDEAEIDGTRHMMLLGTGDGMAFMLDLKTQLLVRLPVNTIEMTQRCHPAYPDICVAPRAPELDCKDLPKANVRVGRRDPYGFDADGDRVGCEGEAPNEDPLGRRLGGPFLSVIAVSRFLWLWGSRAAGE